jgi:P-type Cu+ transporter
MLGPGRDVMVGGFTRLLENKPNMDSLVALGAAATTAVSVVALARPALGWYTYFEEPAMLLAFVMVGRTLEEQAKIRASSDMTALWSLVPQRARLVIVPGAGAGTGTKAKAKAKAKAGTTGEKRKLGSPEKGLPRRASDAVEPSRCQLVPVEALLVGDVVRVLPGDTVPVDGMVVAGRTSVDESALTGESLPKGKGQGDKVTAGTMNCDGVMDVEVRILVCHQKIDPSFHVYSRPTSTSGAYLVRLAFRIQDRISFLLSSR